MSKYKIIARENIKLYLDNITRLSIGESVIIENPSGTRLSTLERYEKLGMIKLIKLEKMTITTVEDESNEPEENNISDDELDFEEYECPECDRKHFIDSNIGKKHLEKYLDKLDE